MRTASPQKTTKNIYKIFLGFLLFFFIGAVYSQTDFWKRVPVISENKNEIPAPPKEIAEPKSAQPEMRTEAISKMEEAVTSTEQTVSAPKEVLPYFFKNKVQRKIAQSEALPTRPSDEPETQTESSPATSPVEPAETASVPSSPFRPQPSIPASQVSVEDRQEKPKTKEATQREFTKPLYVGLKYFAALGANYVQYNEDLTDVAANYRDFRGPSYHLGLSMDLDEKFGFDVAYKMTPMRFDNSSVSLSALEGVWQGLTIEGSYLLGSAQHLAAGKPLDGQISEAANQYKLLVGFQFHQIPLALFENGTNNPIMKNIQFGNVSLGLSYDHYFNSVTRSNVMVRYQFPLMKSGTAGGSVFTTQSTFQFDGSVGLEKKLSGNSWLGFYWYGQLQSFSFSYIDSQVTAIGNYSALFSNAEVRWTFQY